MVVQHNTILPLDKRPPLLRLNHVDKVFGGDVVALKDMTLQVNQGDFISLLGPSGCGKSTALRIISDLMYPTRGPSTGRESTAAAISAWCSRNPR
jgi:NitT/TauT family transport system ATP-binding protein